MYELKKKGKDVYLLSEVARSCSLPINEETTIESQYWIFGKQLTREQSVKAEILISDRTVLDSLVYAYRKFPDAFDSLIPFVREYMKTYHAVIYLPKNDEYLKEDGIRSTNKQFRDEIDKLMLQALEDLDVKTKTYEEVMESLDEED